MEILSVKTSNNEFFTTNILILDIHIVEDGHDETYPYELFLREGLLEQFNKYNGKRIQLYGREFFNAPKGFVELYKSLNNHSDYVLVPVH